MDTIAAACATFIKLSSSSSSIHLPPKIEVKAQHQWRVNCSVKSQEDSGGSSGYSGRSHRKVWRRRQLIKKDKYADYTIERVPFLEEQVRRIRETGKLVTLDIHTLLLSEENRFNFVNQVAAEATHYVDNNRDDYGAKKAIFHVLSNRMNDAGFHRAEAYKEEDPFKPGPGYLKQEL